MSDWADEQGYRLYRECSTFGIGYDKAIGSIATALRKARQDALEEARQVAEGFTGAMHTAHDLKSGVFPKRSYMGTAIASAINDLKDKPPKAC